MSKDMVITNHQIPINKRFGVGLLHIFYCLVIGAWLLVIPPKVNAQSSMDSSNYKIRLGNFNITSGQKSSSSYSLTDTVGQIAAEFFSSTGYHVKAGFQYIYTLYDFTFTISSLAINLGTQTPNTFSTASHTLTVSAPGQGYSVSAYEQTKLTNSQGDTIADTACDSGPCTETSAQPWTIPTNNGFGYNLTGNDIAVDFTTSSYFRPFPDVSLAESPATIMTTAAAGKNRVASVNYQLSVPGTQASGTYTTQIVYIATPVY
jgi:hypothetical protein